VFAPSALGVGLQFRHFRAPQENGLRMRKTNARSVCRENAVASRRIVVRFVKSVCSTGNSLRLGVRCLPDSWFRAIERGAEGPATQRSSLSVRPRADRNRMSRNDRFLARRMALSPFRDVLASHDTA
jgi:hypothetical protein